MEGDKHSYGLIKAQIKVIGTLERTKKSGKTVLLNFDKNSKQLIKGDVFLLFV